MEKINITLPHDYLKKLDDFLKEEKLSRSSFIREATEHYMDEIKVKKELERRRSEIEKAITLQDEFREKHGKNIDWDPVKLIREMRDSR